MKRFLFLVPLLLLITILLPVASRAQVWTAIEPVTLTGGAAIDGTGKDSLYQNGATITTRNLDSLHAFIETEDSTNCRLLAAGIHDALDAQTAANLVKDTVCVKAWATTKAATKGVTYQDFVQAFGGAVPPTLKLYLWIDRDKTGTATDGKKAAVTVKEFEKQ